MVQFNADIADGMPWKFIPTQRETDIVFSDLVLVAFTVRVKPGECALTFYTIENKSSTLITGVSTYNVTPMKRIVGSGVVFLIIAWCIQMRGPLFASIFNSLMLVLVGCCGFFHCVTVWTIHGSMGKEQRDEKLPSIEVVTNSPPTERDHRRPPIHVLVICPTRELASQAATEAVELLKYHPTIGVQIVIAGTRLALEQKRMQANPCQILVATPGRLRDHVENTAGFATRLMGVKVLVLDEADHLLDMGFQKDILNTEFIF
ncbi:hypothetical protein Ahy_B05g075878 [Arachis hypogaea]|uniref:ATP-dependent RNA helicase n=1 Tax=Arachis hypogaea TaxID=3818 RepID=A0A444Z256_ARAHY|nr:hypothetical protein Ahy_B05g075878 [Arachis hypogaea]